MQVIPKYPPQKPCGLKPGIRVRVTQGFTSLDDTFHPNEELIYLREMFDRDLGCDVWIFGTEESKRIEESLPDGGIVNGRYLWHELVRHKRVCGKHGWENPSAWLANFEVLKV